MEVTSSRHLIYGVGFAIGKYPATIDGTKTKEYETWRGMLKRCYEQAYQEKEPTYSGCEVCKEWHCYETFYEWIIQQENYNKWKNGGRNWCIDKDISIKGNKIYSPSTCFLVPKNVNGLFTNRKLHRGELPVGVRHHKKNHNYGATCMNPFTGKFHHIGSYLTIQEAFNAYKKYKENIIKLVAKKEYENGNITERCYNSMLKYEISIED